MSDHTQLLGEIVRLKARIEKLEKALDAKTEWLKNGLDKFAGKANQAEADIDMIVGECGRQQSDMFDRLEAIEAKLFPGIQDGLRHVEKLIGPETNRGYRYDRKKPKNKT